MALPAGTRLGPYEIQSPLGAGGMGEVYRARDPRLGRDVAIKVLPPGLFVDAQRLRRFEQEARTAAALNHPNILAVYDIGTHDDAPFIVSELLEGQTLRELLSSSRLAIQQVLEVATQIADGMAKAHGAAIVHRDLKPENVMVTHDGFAKILDFGLSKLTAPASDYESALTTIDVPGVMHTTPGTVLGTVQYMSPEQAAGRNVDYRSDQFSFGAVLYEMVTGGPAFRRTTAVQTMSAIIEDEPEPIAALNPKVPEPLRWIIARCLAKDPEKRYASTQDLARELRSVSDRLTALRWATPLPGRTVWKWPWRRALATVMVVAAIAVMVAAVTPSLRQALVRRQGITAAIPVKKNLAVLPFRTPSAAAQNQVFADGLTDTLTAKLTLLTTQQSLQVAPADEVRARRIDDAEKARKELGANLVLTGSLEPRGANVRIDCRLIETATSRQLRARVVTVVASDPFAMQDRVLDAAVEMLELELTASERQALARRDTQVAGANQLYLQGRGHLRFYEKPENIDSAIGTFERALKLDANYAAAYAGLGEAYWRKYEITKDTRWTETSLASCTRALVSDTTLAAAHTCLGRLHDGTGRYEEAIVEFQRALDSEPTNDEALAGLGHAEERLGRTDEAEKTYRRAIALRPHYWVNYNRLGHFYYNQARYAEAAEMFAQVVALAPDSFRGYSNLGGAYIQLGRYADAIPVTERSVAIRPTASSYSNLGTAYFNRARFLEAVRAFEEAVKLGETNYAIWGNLADAYHWAPGKRSLAVDAYGKAIALGLQQLKVNARDAALVVDLADYYAMLGRKKEALSSLERALQIAPHDPSVQFRAAIAHNQLGNTDQTLHSLEKARAAGFSMTIIRDTPNFNNLWANPRFQNLLRGQ